MQPKLLLIAALLSWASSSVTYASTITVFNDFGPGNIDDGGTLGRTVRSCATTILILSEGGKHEAADSVYRLTGRLPLAGLVAFSHLQFSQIRGRQPYLIVRRGFSLGCSPVQRLRHTRLGGPYYFRLLNRRRT
jgi:hypothetical protein